nr:pentatricopeptide repeat protein AaPPR512 [Agave angustifolia]
MYNLIGEFSARRQLEEKLISLLAKCSSCSQIQQIQGHIIAQGLHQSPYLAPKIATALFQCKRSSAVALARRWFDQIIRPNVVLYNVMFKGYTEVRLYEETLHLFHEMTKQRGKDGFFVAPNAYTFTFILKACSLSLALREGEQVHCFTVKTGWFQTNHFVGTLLIDLYSLRIGDAYKVFEEMQVRNVVAWTAIIRAYISVGDVESARQLFDQTTDRDVVLWNTMMLGYTEQGDMVATRKLFAQMPCCDRDAMSWNTVLLGYANADGNLVEECERFFFEDMPSDKRNVFSWNGLIGVYFRHGWFSSVLSAFRQMLFHASSNHVVEPSEATLSIVLSACSKLGTLGWGRGIHSYAAKRHHELLRFSCVGNGLIDMYAKCGCIDDAVSVFDSMEGTRDVITWNSMIGGLAAHGRGMEALELFEQMQEVGECRPDGITFVGVLSACMHSVGLVERGIAYFRSMVEEYMIVPWIEHYGCVVGLLGRARLVDEALGLVRRMSMSMDPDSVIWSTLLGVCQQVDEHGHAHEHPGRMLIIAELAMSRLVRLEPEDGTHYVMLSKVYGACRRWADVARLKQVVNRMYSLHGKLPGWSWVQVYSHSHSQLVELLFFRHRALKNWRFIKFCKG